MKKENYLLDHKLYETVETIQLKFSIIIEDSEFNANLSELGMNTLNRLHTMVSYLSTRLDSTDPYLLIKSNLDTINTDLENLIPILEDYEVKFSDVNQLTSLNHHCDKILLQLNNILTARSESDVDTIRTSVITLRKSVGQHKSILERQQEDIEIKSKQILDRVDVIGGNVDEYESRLEEKTRSFEEKYQEMYNSFITSQENRSQDFLNLKQELTTAANVKEKEIDKKFESIINHLEIEKNKYVEELESDNEININSIKERYNKLLLDTETEREKYNEELEKHKSSIEELVGIVSTSAVSAHFKEVADYKRKISHNWQTLTVIGFAFTIGFGIYSFIFNNKELDAYNLIARIIVTTAIGSFTAYAARQATKNERDEKSNREMEVELKTLNPYIASFDEADQTYLKKTYFTKIFQEVQTKDINDHISRNDD